MSRLALSLLGPPRIERDGVPVRVSRHKAVALLAYLAVTGQIHRRDALSTLLWPEQDQSRARAGLRRALAALKEALGEGWLEADRESIGLNLDSESELDVRAFRERLAECRGHGHPSQDVCADCLSSLAEAADLYRGDFLAGFTLRDSPGFDDWQFFQTQELRDELASALERMVEGHSARGEFQRAIAHARRWLALDPLHEPAHRSLMQLYAWSGQRAAALRQYQECERVLQEELGASPEEGTAELYRATVEHREVPSPVEPGAASPTSGTSVPRRQNLPAQLIPFVGREALLGRDRPTPGRSRLSATDPGRAWGQWQDAPSAESGKLAARPLPRRSVVCTPGIRRAHGRHCSCYRSGAWLFLPRRGDARGSVGRLPAGQANTAALGQL